MDEFKGFRLAARDGGPDSSLMGRCLTRLNNLFGSLPATSYCEEVRLFSPHVEVSRMGDGWGRPGVRNVCYWDSNRSMTVDIFVEETAWGSRDVVELRILLATRLHHAFGLMVQRIQREGWRFDEEKFMSHSNSVLQAFLSDIGSYSPAIEESDLRTKQNPSWDLGRLTLVDGRLTRLATS